METTGIIGILLCFIGIMGYILRFYREKGTETGNYYNGVMQGYIAFYRG